MVGACDCSTEPSESCAIDSDCVSGVCINELCAEPVDVGPGVDGGPGRDVLAPM